jgi:hypothetical protein
MLLRVRHGDCKCGCAKLTAAHCGCCRTTRRKEKYAPERLKATTAGGPAVEKGSEGRSNGLKGRQHGDRNK